MPRKKKEDETVEEVSTDTTVKGTELAVTPVEVVIEKPKKVKAQPKTEALTKISEVTDTNAPRKTRATRIGIVTSDKMTKTVVVRVDRLIKHPRYRKYIRRKKQFMAHDELGSNTGDKVMIVETRPLSARKRWRVLQIIQKAEK